MFVCKDNWKDVHKYYQHTYVKFKETGEEVFYVTEVNPQEVIAENNKKDLVGILLEEGYTIDYIIPKRTCFQYNDTSVVLSRIPARQWKKGLCKENTKFEVLTATGTWHNMPVDFNTVNGYVGKKQYLSIAEALAEFKRESLQSCALNSRMSLSKNGYLYVDKVLIGKIDFENLKGLFKKIFKPEVTSLFGNLLQMKYT